MVKTHRKVTPGVILAIASSLVLSAMVVGQTSDALVLSWSAIAGGGSRSSAGRFAINDSLGQPVASNPTPTVGERYSVSDGFLQLGSVETAIYLPVVSSRSP